MLFAKQELGIGNLVLSSGKAQWTGWRESKLADLRLAMLQNNGNFFKAWVTTLGELVGPAIRLTVPIGKHSIWTPIRIGRYSITVCG